MYLYEVETQSSVLINQVPIFQLKSFKPYKLFALDYFSKGMPLTHRVFISI